MQELLHFARRATFGRLVVPCTLSVIALAWFVPACGKDDPGPKPRVVSKVQKPRAIGPAPGSSNSPHVAAPAAPSKRPEAVEGVVAETMDAKGYTYLKLTTPEGEVWAAVPRTKLQKGARVAVRDPAPMPGFESPTLGRKFDLIYFGAGVGPAGGAVPDKADPHGAVPTPQGHSRAVAHQRAEFSSPLPKAEGPSGRTIAEIYAGKAELDRKPVAVRGRVVSFKPQILKRNWLHIQDGTGGDDSYDLIVTTQDQASVSDTVVVKGVLRVDKNFGMGLQYPVIVENAKLELSKLP